MNQSKIIILTHNIVIHQLKQFPTVLFCAKLTVFDDKSIINLICAFISIPKKLSLLKAPKMFIHSLLCYKMGAWKKVGGTNQIFWAVRTFLKIYKTVKSKNLSLETIY